MLYTAAEIYPKAREDDNSPRTYNILYIHRPIVWAPPQCLRCLSLVARVSGVILCAAQHGNVSTTEQSSTSAGRRCMGKWLSLRCISMIRSTALRFLLPFTWSRRYRHSTSLISLFGDVKKGTLIHTGNSRTCVKTGAWLNGAPIANNNIGHRDTW
jgi:hypothetical protein